MRPFRRRPARPVPDAHLRVRKVRPSWAQRRRRLGLAVARRWRPVLTFTLDAAALVGLVAFAWLVWRPAAVLVAALSCLAIAWVIDRPRG